MQKQLSPDSPSLTAPGFAAVLACTIFVSAFLLFQVQPLISKYILPWFGGSPAVWTTAMLFFQCVLFCGYAYAHLTSRLFSLKQQAMIHLGILLIASAAAWFVTPADWLKPSGNENPTMAILVLLSVCVGWPYFTLATTGPLIQAWFSHAYPGKSPYRLYSLSNIGSLLALLSFPYLFEPNFELPTMGRCWTIGFWIFGLLCAVAAKSLFGLHLATTAKRADALPVQHDPDSVPQWWQRGAWVLLPMLASLMFIATTDHVSHDVAPEPRLRIVTLSLYLLTFIICFDHERWYVRGLIAPLCIASIVLLTVVNETSWIELTLRQSRWLHFGVMFLICLLCHGELVKLRPKSHKYLTEFYLGMSAGGALGGLFISLIATNYFHDYYEWTLGSVLGLGLAAVVICHVVSRFNIPALRLVIGGIAIALAGFVFYENDPFTWRVSSSKNYNRKILSQSRNFYGTITVQEREHRTDPAESFRVFYSGNIQHGMQFTLPEKRLIPTSYYSLDSGCGQTFVYAQKKLPAMRVAVVGLGVGTLARFARPTDQYDFFEINPAVVEIADRDFTYMRDCQAAEKRVILGDARLKLEELAEDVKYDIIVLDAFSGDSVPVHLLTKEAFEIYNRHLKPNGFIVTNITNSFLNLYPVVKKQAEHLGIGFRHNYHPGDYDQLIYRSHYFIITRDQTYLAEYPSVTRKRYDPADKTKVIGEFEHELPNIPLWTDHFSSINAIEFSDR